MDSEAAIEIENVHRRFGTLAALDGVSFSVPKGSIFALLGPNGAGKTTLFSVIAGFLRAHAGHIRVLGTPVSVNASLQGRMSILPQDALFQRNVPILDQLVTFRRLDGLSHGAAEEEVRHTLAQVGLEDYVDRGVQVLSHGMTKRLGVAQAFLGQPEVILLDEPTEGLDPRNAHNIRTLIHELKGQATVVVSSHNLSEVQDLCDDVAIMRRGKLVASGPVEVVTGGGQQLDLQLNRDLNEPALEALKSIVGVETVAPRGDRRYMLAITPSETRDCDAITRELLETLLRHDLLPRMFRQGSSLEETFLELTSDE